ncbi:GNAT family N-acetyltransferase [Halpernia frigidisoli]|uniref:Ribosomal protein S18 acetylase RimI n=1 Tax=Halpernia frigidisoli TaxID=1125876 RepID=A0A1I3GGZ5_9FLAO|nr:GNAT family N-acetyltransferase [Halpernia frigidisoli]SFI22411.1 Ribosomal protein S18 acetylase RimI [Halpernia frigidisoli]
MEFNLIDEFEDFRVKSIFEAYCDTFPENERRSESQFENLFKKEKVSVFSIVNNSQFIGYFIMWDLEGFAFLEHFEIFEAFRSNNFGSEVLQKLKENYSKIILESEPEHFNSIAGKRIKFYQRNGFKIISENYIQPSYGEGKPDLNLLLFANFQPKNLEKITENIYDVVYGK